MLMLMLEIEQPRYNGAWAMLARERTFRQIRAAYAQKRIYSTAWLRSRAKRRWRG